MRIFVGAETIISPLGENAEENFNQLLQGSSGIKKIIGSGFNKEDLYISAFEKSSDKNFSSLLENVFVQLAKRLSGTDIKAKDFLVIISSTKGDIASGLEKALINPAGNLQAKFNLAHFPLIVSNGCVSGVMAINHAARLIRHENFKTIFVIGIDMVSDFVLYGFQSLFAISDQPCKPFDRDRKGINLGEACSGIVLSSGKAIFNETCYEYLSGTSSNDANHISGPSRNGEGLYRTVKKTMEASGVSADEIDFISAHGTGTLYNDDMESIAFERSGLSDIPLNSLKGYYGHTLGAAGVLETAVCMQSIKNNMCLRSMGYETPGTPSPINVLAQNLKKETQVVLKTVSGFGGANASLILRKA